MEAYKKSICFELQAQKLVCSVLVDLERPATFMPAAFV